MAQYQLQVPAWKKRKLDVLLVVGQGHAIEFDALGFGAVVVVAALDVGREGRRDGGLDEEPIVAAD